MRKRGSRLRASRRTSSSSSAFFLRRSGDSPRTQASCRGARRQARSQRGRGASKLRRASAAVASTRAAPDSRPPAAAARCTPWSPRLRAQPRRERVAPGVARCFLGAASQRNSPASVAIAPRPRPREARGRRARARCWTRAGTRALQVEVTWRRPTTPLVLRAPRLGSARDTWRGQRVADIKRARRPSSAFARQSVRQLRRCGSSVAAQAPA